MSIFAPPVGLELFDLKACIPPKFAVYTVRNSKIRGEKSTHRSSEPRKTHVLCLFAGRYELRATFAVKAGKEHDVPAGLHRKDGLEEIAIRFVLIKQFFNFAALGFKMFRFPMGVTILH